MLHFQGLLSMFLVWENNHYSKDRHKGFAYGSGGMF